MILFHVLVFLKEHCDQYHSIFSLPTNNYSHKIFVENNKMIFDLVDKEIVEQLHIVQLLEFILAYIEGKLLIVCTGR